MPTATVSRAQACLVAHLCGDTLGALVEFRDVDWIRATYPDGVRAMADGGTFHTLAGQPTDDGEMTLALARTLVGAARYDAAAARAAYRQWIGSNPFDRGATIANALSGSLNPHSQANGAMMRIAPLGILGARCSLEDVARWADQDAALTHPHPVCRQANALYAAGLAHAIATGADARATYAFIAARAAAPGIDPALAAATAAAATAPPPTYTQQIGWVLIAWQNALWQLLHAPSLEEGIVATIMQGGDTDTNAAIAGALLGAVYGMPAVPERWCATLRGCRADQGEPGAPTRRPREYWPCDAEALAAALCEG